MSKTSSFRSMLACALFMASCSTKPAASPEPRRDSSTLTMVKPSPSQSAREHSRELPPPPGLTPDAPFPAIIHRKLGNGLALRVVMRRDRPVVELRLVIFSGQASDGAKTGLAAVAGELLKAGGAGSFSSRELLERAESLGARLDVTTDRDATTLAIAVTEPDFERALEILGALAQKPRFDAIEFMKLKQRETERVTSLARTSAGWVASMVMYRELYHLPAAIHPYAQYDTTPTSLGKIGLADCKTWHKQHFVPKNALLVLAGHVDPELATRVTERVFGTWNGEAPAKPSFTSPLVPERFNVHVVDRPGSPQAQIYLATLGPDRKSDDWAALKVANQILGGGVSGRLFLDVREKRSLAYSTGSSIEEVARGPVPLVLSAGTQTPKTALAVAGLLEHMARIGSTFPNGEEVATATRYLSDSFLISMETTSAVASLTARLAVLGLPDDYYDEYRKAARAVRVENVSRVAARYFRQGNGMLVVAGDAARIARPLSRFGPVSVIEPEQNFATRELIAHDPAIPLAETQGPSK